MRSLRLASLTIALAVVSLGAAHADQPAAFRIGGDLFVAGAVVTVAEPIEGDLFAAGETVELRGRIGGNAHLAGRDLRLDAQLRDDVYAAGYDIRLAGPIAHDVTAAGYSVAVGAPEVTIGGNLRVAGQTVRVAGRVTGHAMIAADVIELDGVIAGDADLAARTIRFGDGARIGGTLRYTAPEQLEVPPAVATPERVVARVATDLARPGTDVARASRATGLGWFLGLLVIGALLLALFRRRVGPVTARMRGHPKRAVGWGFVTLSVLIGANFVLAASVVGLIVVPLVLLAFPLALLVGYLLGVFALGERLWLAAGRLPVSGWLPRVGLLAAALALFYLVGLVPYLGWLLGLLVTLFGLGGLVLAGGSALVPPPPSQQPIAAG
jgi:cytoskeletal protein CcmA (bactofilin family)